MFEFYSCDGCGNDVRLDVDDPDGDDVYIYCYDCKVRLLINRSNGADGGIGDNSE